MRVDFVTDRRQGHIAICRSSKAASRGVLSDLLPAVTNGVSVTVSGVSIVAKKDIAMSGVLNGSDQR